MKGIAIVIPTLDSERGQATGRLAKVTSGCQGNVRVIVSLDDKKQGFSRTVNAGIRRSGPGEDICILNDDITEFQYCWLEVLRRVLYSEDVYGLSGPSGKSASSPASKGGPGQHGVQVVGQLSFWCVLLKREMIDEIGILDEDFIHYCSDTWYCQVTMVDAGWKCAWARSVYLNHKHHGSGIPDKWKQHDREIFFKRKNKR